MKRFALCCVAAFTLLSTASFAATDQQNKMTLCNQQAGDKKGDERKAFMSNCLKKDAAPPMSQQDKMKHCNATAGDRKGDERKAFMSQCLKKTG